jgi:nucleotide-binding universal stress UspA family protein
LIHFYLEGKMKKITKIVVPLDFTKSTDKLVDYAVYMAESLQAAIDFVHVVPDYPGDAMIGSPYAQKYQDKDFSVSKKKMANIVEDCQERSPGCSGEVVYGDPVSEIVGFAESRNADLLIISTHDAKGLEKILLGNVAEHVLRKAHCPVLIMKPVKDIT